MHKFNYLYNPITATPFRNDSSYIEIIPCISLRPYIKCFWGTSNPVAKIKKDVITEELIIPDTCMDIIFDVNNTDNRICSNFIGINNEAFRVVSTVNKEETTSIFAIRFYAWTAALFSEESMSGVKNNAYDVQQHFSKIKSTLEPYLFDKSTMNERVAIAERLLINQINTKRFNPNLVAAIFYILNKKGNIRTDSLANEVHISNRQLERIFNEYTGVSPKQLTSLVRYQNLWNDILFHKHFNVTDAVHFYGYTDQSHLLRDFKKYHTVLPGEARQHALSIN